MGNESKPGWHWPQFEDVLCAQLSEREILGLPDYFVENRYADIISSIYRKLTGSSEERLYEMVEDRNASLPERLVAGEMLALIRDPRISTFDPEMRTIKGATVTVGLHKEAIASVMENYRGLGLDEKWIAKECPRHDVLLDDFRIARYPVTNQEYKDFLCDTHYPEIPSSWAFRQFPQERSNHPVYTISPAAAQAYANWLAQATGRLFRLPTEAEWEYAAAGPCGFEFPWGDEYRADYANTAETGLFRSTPVGIFIEGHSPFDVTDMAGNVEEYVSDIYASYPGGQFIDDHLAQVNPGYQVARGGCFARFRDLARTRRRHGHNPRSPAYVMGFRLAESLGQ